jgi:DNA adenine methylase
LHWLKELPYTEEIFQQAKEIMRSPDWADDVDRAVSVMVWRRFSRNGLGEDFCWSERLRGKTRPCGPQPGDKNAWETILEMMPRIAERLQGVKLHHMDAAQVIRRYNSPNTLFYLDPPYPHETRTAPDMYTHEMTAKDHEELLDLILKLRGTVFISGYHCPLYDNRLASWQFREFDMPNHSGQGEKKEPRTEVLWSNR